MDRINLSRTSSLTKLGSSSSLSKSSEKDVESEDESNERFSSEKEERGLISIACEGDEKGDDVDGEDDSGSNAPVSADFEGKDDFEGEAVAAEKEKEGSEDCVLTAFTVMPESKLADEPALTKIQWRPSCEYLSPPLMSRNSSRDNTGSPMCILVISFILPIVGSGVSVEKVNW